MLVCFPSWKKIQVIKALSFICLVVIVVPYVTFSLDNNYCTIQPSLIVVVVRHGYDIGKIMDLPSPHLARTLIRLLSNIMGVAVLIGAVATIPVSIVEWMMFA
jgi:hypothetical protein